jgi:integrase
MTRHLTDATVRDLTPPDRGNRIVYDDHPKAPGGFGIRVTAAGAKAFVIRYRVKDTGQQRTFTIGQYPSWQLAKARERAGELRRDIDGGGDPLGRIEQARAEPTMPDLIERFTEEHLPRLRPSSRVLYANILQKHIAPAFGAHMKVAAVKFADVDDLHRKITKTAGPYAANRTKAVLSKMFSLAEKWEWRNKADNPCLHVERNPESKRKRYLLADELARLTAALTKYPDQQFADIIRMLLLTGARKGEVRSMKWADLDLEKGIWTKLGSATKQKSDHVVPLSAPARQLLSEIYDAQRSKPSEWVFPSNRGHLGHVFELKDHWRELITVAKITGLRIHDLRHSFASQLASAGASLPLIGALLGHSNAATTARYAHLFQDPQRAAVEKVAAIMTGAPAAEVKPLRPKKRRPMK